MSDPQLPLRSLYQGESGNSGETDLEQEGVVWVQEGVLLAKENPGREAGREGREGVPGEATAGAGGEISGKAGDGARSGQNFLLEF